MYTYSVSHAITFTVFPPPAILAHDIECIRVATHEGSDQGLEVKVCPNGLPGLVFGLSEKGTSAIESIATSLFNVTDIPILFLHGQGATPSIMRFSKGGYTTIQVVLKPYALYDLFALDASELGKGFMVPEDFGEPDLTEKICQAGTDSERITLLCDALTRKKEQSSRRDEMIEKSLELIHNNIASVAIKDLPGKLHVSERQFQKRFARVVGMPAQLYLRVKRVNEALRLMSTGQYERLSDVAYALNFYDQPHFIREMKTFSWVTPKDITQKVRDFHQDLGGASYL